MKPTTQDIGVLSAFQVGGAMTAPELAAMTLSDKESLRMICERLYSHCLLNVERVPGRPAIFTIAFKGRNLLRRLSGKPMGDMPAPKTSPSSEPYKPKPIHTRAGSDEFLKAPSRTGETLTQYRPPVSMCGEQVRPV